MQTFPAAYINKMNFEGIFLHMFVHANEGLGKVKYLLFTDDLITMCIYVITDMLTEINTCI